MEYFVLYSERVRTCYQQGFLGRSKEPDHLDW